MQTHIIARVSFYGPANMRGARVKITLPKFKKARVFPYDYHTGNAELQAERALEAAGIEIVGRAEYGKGKEVIILQWPDDGITASNIGKFFNI
jgi:hypothetical protein